MASRRMQRQFINNDNIAPPPRNLFRYHKNRAKHRDLRCVSHLQEVLVLGAKHVANPNMKPANLQQRRSPI